MTQGCDRNEGALDLRPHQNLADDTPLFPWSPRSTTTPLRPSRSVEIPPLSGEGSDVTAHWEGTQGPGNIVGLLGYLIKFFAVVVSTLHPYDPCVLFSVGCIAARKGMLNTSRRFRLLLLDIR